MVQNWTLAIDKALRRSAGARMPSEWAKKVECWDTLRETGLESPASLPPELRAQASSEASSEHDNPEPNETVGTDRDIDSLILRVRPLFGRVSILAHNELVERLSEILGYSPAESPAQDEVENVIRAAVRRSILQSDDDGYALVSRNIADYPRDVLKDQFLARVWTHNLIQ